MVMRRFRVEGGKFGSGQNILRVLSGQAVLKSVLSGELDMKFSL
jgi:hypothetical protein